MWHPIRNLTIEKLLEIKDEVVAVILKERAVKVAATTSGLAIGGTMVIIGLALAPLTFGGSLGLTVAGGAVSVATSISGIVASVVSTAKEKGKLKLAQEHIMFDTQFSLAIKDFQLKVKRNSDRKFSLAVAVGTQLLSNFGHFGVRIITTGVEVGIDAGTAALATILRTAGTVTAGISLAVTLPIDIGVIAYYAYQLSQLKKDNSGMSDKNEFIRWIIVQLEELLKSKCYNLHN